MAPPPPSRKPVPKERFSALFSTLKTQSYYDPASRGPGSHAIRSVAWNPAGHLIATGSADKSLRIWNPEKPEVKNSTELRGHTGPIEQVAWNPVKEAELASVSLDGTCKFWDVRSKGCVETVQLGSDGLSLSWATDGSLVLVGSRKEETLTPVLVPSFTVQTPLPQYTQTNRTIFAPAPTPSSPSDHHIVFISTGSGIVKVAAYPTNPSSSTTAATFTPLHTINSHTSSCSCLELSPNGRYLATGGSDALISLWDTQDWVCRRTLARMVGGVKSLSFSWDGNYIVGGSDEGTGLEIAHVESGEYVHTVPTSVPACCVAWHPSRYWLAYSGDTGGLKIVGAAGGQL